MGSPRAWFIFVVLFLKWDIGEGASLCGGVLKVLGLPPSTEPLTEKISVIYFPHYPTRSNLPTIQVAISDKVYVTDVFQQSNDFSVYQRWAQTNYRRQFLEIPVLVTEKEVGQGMEFAEKGSSSINCAYGVCRLISRSGSLWIPPPISFDPTLTASYLLGLKAIRHPRIGTLQWHGQRPLRGFMSGDLLQTLTAYAAIGGAVVSGAGSPEIVAITSGGFLAYTFVHAVRVMSNIGKPKSPKSKATEDLRPISENGGLPK